MYGITGEPIAKVKRLKTKTSRAFQELALPGRGTAYIPADITILFPAAPDIPTEDIHYLAYIPWDDRYLAKIPRKYRDFFAFALPYLHARTSDIHTALSVAQLPKLFAATSVPFDDHAVYLALILHDCGWSEVSQQELVTSLSYDGVIPVGDAALKPKQQHLIFGEALAYKLLDAFDFGSNGPTDADKYYIAEIIRRHDNDAPWEVGKYGEISIEMELACDGDRLWSFTHENFWLDTIRKQIQPEEYLDIITSEIPTYFFTEPGRARARELVARRRKEIDKYLAHINQLPPEDQYDSDRLISRLSHLGRKHPTLGKLLDKTRRAYAAYHDA